MTSDLTKSGFAWTDQVLSLEMQMTQCTKFEYRYYILL
jgi:hypothetical protein